MALQSYIESLRQKPLDTRVRILWITTIVLGVVLLIAWGSFRSLQPVGTEDENSGSILNTFQENLDDAQEQQEPAPQPVRILDASLLGDTHVVITFSVENNTNSILSLFNSDHTNVKLVSETASSTPISAATDLGDPFPRNLLSRATQSGVLIFPNPGTGPATIVFSDMYFGTVSIDPFSQEIPITIEEELVNPQPRQ